MRLRPSSQLQEQRGWLADVDHEPMQTSHVLGTQMRLLQSAGCREQRRCRELHDVRQ